MHMAVQLGGVCFLCVTDSAWGLLHKEVAGVRGARIRTALFVRLASSLENCSTSGLVTP